MKTTNDKIVQFFSTLADDTRLRILLCLVEKPCNVNEIHKSIGKGKMTLSAISHQLKHLSDIEIVVYEKKGREKIFQLSDKFCWCILRDALKHFNGKTECKECCKIKKSIK